MSSLAEVLCSRYRHEEQLAAVQDPHPPAELEPESLPLLLKPKREKSFSTAGLPHVEHSIVSIRLITSFSNFSPHVVHRYS